jgi:hypothetical protein
MLGPHFLQCFGANLDFSLDEQWMSHQPYHVSKEESTKMLGLLSEAGELNNQIS